jgi:fructose-1,6-bisphosphatase/inositol monophosphatase family enzyme
VVDPTSAASESILQQFQPERLKVSLVESLKSACVATEMGYSRDLPSVELMLGKLHSLLAKSTVQSVRMAGSCCFNMCFVAAGKMDAYYEGISTLAGPKPWDVAAAALIVSEAGGVVLDVSGGPFSIWSGRVLVAANAKLGKEVADSLEASTKEWAGKFPEKAAEIAANVTRGGLAQQVQANASAKL